MTDTAARLFGEHTDLPALIDECIAAGFIIGDDRSPGGLYLAVSQDFCRRGFSLEIYYGGFNLYYDYDKPRGMADHSWGHYIYMCHNRSPNAIAAAALGLWLWACDIPANIDDHGRVTPRALDSEWKTCPTCYTNIRQVEPTDG